MGKGDDSVLHQGTSFEEEDFETSPLYLAIYEYVQKYMSRYDMSHDFNHVLRVLDSAKYILAKEFQANQDKAVSRDAVVLSALLHDVGDRKYVQPGEKAEDLIKDILRANSCDSEMIEKVCSIVAHVSYSNEIKQSGAVRDAIKAHPELAIVQDADRLDAIGAIGIGRTFAFGASKGSDRGLQGPIDHFGEKLERLEPMMKTATGRNLALERTRRLREFRKWWDEECNSDLWI